MEIVDTKKTVYFVSTHCISDIETFSLHAITIVVNTLRKEKNSCVGECFKPIVNQNFLT